MFIDSPRDYSIKHLSDINKFLTRRKNTGEKVDLYEEKEKIYTAVKDEAGRLSIGKMPLMINVSGENGEILKIFVKTPETSFTLTSTTDLALQNRQTARCLNYNTLMEKFKAVNDTEFFIERLDLKGLQENLFIPFKEITSLGKKLLFTLKGGKEPIAPVDLPVLKKQTLLKNRPTPSVIISSEKDLHLCSNSSSEFFYMLPACVAGGDRRFIDLFLENRKIKPWFPSILIGEHYTRAVNFLHEVKPDKIVTDNTGIAHEACKRGINWIAGPHLNIVNSFSLLCLKEKLNCSGAFISNEINQEQIKRIVPPDDFKLYYSIYHPILLMTSRQCLFHQVTGCEKNIMDDTCLLNCSRSSSITSLKETTIYIEKTFGNYHSLFNQYNFLNTDIKNDLPGMFSGFSIDLRDIKTETTPGPDKLKIINLFEDYISGNAGAENQLKQILAPTTNRQYKKGI